MSLKAFHILFIVASTLLALAVGAWGVQRYLTEGSGSHLVLGVAFFALGLALVVYGVRFFGKLRRLAE